MFRCHRLLLCAALLTCCTEQSSAHGPPEKVLAHAGGHVTLPCSIVITESEDFPTVEWSKEGLKSQIVFLYRDGYENYGEKDQAFEFRTSLIPKELKKGNISLRISNLQLSDAGIYQCKTLWKKPRWESTRVELVVGAVSEPKLSVVSSESGGVTLQCEADCWLPEPEIRFLDEEGNTIPADDPRRQQDARGCHTVTRRVTLQDATKRVTCRVHQPEVNQTRNTQILIPVGDLCSCPLTTCLAVGVAVLLLLALCGLAFWLWKSKCGHGQKQPVTRQSSGESELSGTSDSNLLLSVKAEMADSVGKAKLQVRDETSRQLQNNNTSQLCSVTCHLDQPTIACSPSTFSPDVPNPFGPPSDHGPQARNQSSDQNLKSTASSNPPATAHLPQNKGLKPAISRQNSFPAPNQRNLIPSPALLDSSGAVSSSSFSASTAKKPLSPIGRTMSESLAQHDPLVTQVLQRQRISSCPAIFDSSVVVPSSSFSASTAKKTLVHIRRSLSDAHARPIIPKIKRRPSSNRRFSLLEDLPESEQW